MAPSLSTPRTPALIEAALGEGRHHPESPGGKHPAGGKGRRGCRHRGGRRPGGAGTFCEPGGCTGRRDRVPARGPGPPPGRLGPRCSPPAVLRVRRPLFFGAGNVVELMDADSIGQNALLAAMAAELGAAVIFTGEHSDKTRGSVAEMRRATEMMVLSRDRPYPKDLGIDLLVIKEKRRRREPPPEYSETVLAGPAPREVQYDPAGTSGSASREARSLPPSMAGRTGARRGWTSSPPSSQDGTSPSSTTPHTWERSFTRPNSPSGSAGASNRTAPSDGARRGPWFFAFARPNRRGT